MIHSQQFFPPVMGTNFDAVAPFADPFADLASTNMPVSVPAMLRHAEFFGVSNETMREAFVRAAAYFLTDLVVDGDLGQDEQDNQREYLVDRAGVMGFLLSAGVSELVYGNQYTSVLMPFVRYLNCPKCSAQYTFKEFSKKPRYNFRWQSGFFGRCAACNFDGDFGDPEDVPDDSRPLILKSWNPHDIRVVYNEATGQTVAYDWVIPADFRSDVRMGYNLAALGETPWPWVQAVLRDENVRMEPDFLHHWREPTLAGLRVRGVGVPRSLTNFRQVYYAQILRRMNEVLAIGHVVPMRVISPANTAGRDPSQGDILQTGFLGDLRARVMNIIANHRRDPNSYHFSPVALQLQALGADARQLIPADILNQALEVLLNGCGIPVEFYRGSMQTQNAPVGLRLIERVWQPFVDGLNRLLNFIGRRAQYLLSWPEAKYSLKSVRIVDAIETQQLRVQMAQAGLLSRSTALQQVDADFRAETKQKLDDMRTEQMAQAEFEKEMDAYAFSQQLGNAQPLPGTGGPGGPPVQQGAGGPPQMAAQGDQGQQGGGAQQAAGVPAGSDPLAGMIPQPGQRIDPQSLISQAQQVAGYLLSIPEGQRFGKLQEIRKTNETFHSLVRAQMDKMRSQARSQGGQQMMQQQFGNSS